LKNDLKFMRLALSLAQRGYGMTSPNPMVGAVLMKGDKIIGRGWHRRAGLPHAEIEALRDAQKHRHSARGTTLYVTLEPCSTHGRTPPCMDAIIAAGIRRVVIGSIDPNPKHSGRGFKILKRAGIAVTRWGETPSSPNQKARKSGLERLSPHQTKKSSNPLTLAVCDALRDVIGAYGIAVVCADQPDTIVGARRGSPLIIGIGKGENFLASDANAIVAHTKKVVYLNDYDVATVTSKRFDVLNLGADTATVQISKLEFSQEDAARGKFPHFMLKEIFEQPETVENALRGRVDMKGATAKFGGLNLTPAELRSIKRIVIAASGTSWHAALVGEYLIEELAQIPVEVEFAHEFCYRNAPLERDTVLLVISQSGETADTLAALREARKRGHRALAIVNVVGSTIARESDGGIYMHAGPEIGVASTKAFVSTLTILALLAVHLGRMRQLSAHRALEILRALEAAPKQLEAILAQSDAFRKIALKYAKADDFFFLGRGYTFPIALEGALKLKEISYIHAEGYSAAEMKHGPIALIDPKTPTVFLVPQDSMHDKTMANLAMIRARKGPIIALATKGDKQIGKVADDVIYLPKTLEPIYPILATVPLQLFAYHIAVARGCDVDKPRNLAKSVTVE
jgi:glucosamine--fructose-6-phosphate aminotransferase (isomerizing)